MEHECTPPRSGAGELPPYDTLWRCSCGKVWAVGFVARAGIDGASDAGVKMWVPSSRLRWVKRFGLRAQ